MFCIRFKLLNLCIILDLSLDPIFYRFGTLKSAFKLSYFIVEFLRLNFEIKTKINHGYSLLISLAYKF